MFKHFLVPISNPLVNKLELQKLIQLAIKEFAKVTLVYVSDPVGPYMDTESVARIKDSEKAHKKASKDLAKQLFKNYLVFFPSEIKVDTLHVIRPNIADGVVEAAEKVSADVVVMNSHKKNGIKNIFLKDEACDIILHSKFPVLILNS
jgi:nucleotide-binding universal stress UspA family protein